MKESDLKPMLTEHNLAGWTMARWFVSNNQRDDLLSIVVFNLCNVLGF